MANIITYGRILFSVILLFCPVFSPAFYAVYLTAGFTDMIDGTVARKTHTVSEFGSKLDTASDFVFVMVCLIKLLPAINVPLWLWVWIAVIAVIKIANMIFEIIIHKRFISEHTVMNKITGLLLFLLHFTFQLIEFRYSAFIVCTVASLSAVLEGITLKKANHN